MCPEELDPFKTGTSGDEATDERLLSKTTVVLEDETTTRFKGTAMSSTTAPGGSVGAMPDSLAGDKPRRLLLRATIQGSE